MKHAYSTIICLLTTLCAHAGLNIQSGENFQVSGNPGSENVSSVSYQGTSYNTSFQMSSVTANANGRYDVSGSGGIATVDNEESGDPIWDTTKRYLLHNAKGYGYCIYDPDMSDDFPSLGGYTDGVNGCVIDLYKQEVDPQNENNQWYIQYDDSGYYLYNIGRGKYISNRDMYWAFVFTDTPEPFTVTQYDDSCYAFRLVHWESFDEYYMCAASQHSGSNGTYPIAQWYITDDGSQWLIEEVTDAVVTDPDGGDEVNDSTVEEAGSIYVEHSDDYLFVRNADSTVVVIPRDFVTAYDFDGSTFTASISNGDALSLKGVLSVVDEVPDDVPSFTSYKFNNKYNSQVFTDAICEDPSGNDISLSVGCIGKWLTASFRLSMDGTKVWVDTTRQYSKRTRQSFASPVTYTLTNSRWQLLQLMADSTFATTYVDYPNPVTVTVNFLSDNPTTDYGVPRIDITLSNTDAWSSSNWVGMNGKSYYEAATIEIDGAGVYPDMESTPIQIKGRGNSTWYDSYTSKNPYHIKFFSKDKPLGMTAGKHWVLLSNKQKGSMTTGAIGHKVSNIFEVAGTNHIVPVELYINGSYRGSYDLTESIGFRNNSVDLVDETYAAMIELDTYDDETIYNSNAYSLPAKIHEPDLEDEEIVITSDTIISDFNTMVSSVYNGDDSYLSYVDADSLSRFLSANEYIGNRELGHPKSVFLYSANVTDGLNAEGVDETPWVFGPLWDCDWSYGYEGTYTYFIAQADYNYFADALVLEQGENPKKFWNALRYNSTEVDSLVYSLYYKFVNNGGFDELIDYCDEYYAFANAAFTHNSSNETSDTDGSNYKTVTSNCKNWLSRRINAIMSQLTPYEVPEEVYEDDEDDEDGTIDPDEGEGTGEGEEDAIEEIPYDYEYINYVLATTGKVTIYDLNGRQVSKEHVMSHRGIYIVNGRKVVR